MMRHYRLAILLLTALFASALALTLINLQQRLPGAQWLTALLSRTPTALSRWCFITA
ncbi:hypothetical protein ERHA55_42220 [Erwinia rhapontici]|nr:hypothetical protein ERHA55_42220 [Erwinia rhapontici]